MNKYTQVCNPKTKKFLKIDTNAGRIVSHKRTKGPYQNIMIVGKRYDLEQEVNQ